MTCTIIIINQFANLRVGMQVCLPVRCDALMWQLHSACHTAFFPLNQGHFVHQFLQSVYFSRLGRHRCAIIAIIHVALGLVLRIRLSILQRYDAEAHVEGEQACGFGLYH